MGADGPQATVDYRMQQHHGYHVSLLFLFRLRLGRSKKKGSDVELGGSCENCKVRKTKDLDMVKNLFFADAPLVSEIQKWRQQDTFYV
jgi:hypothetical protein